MTFKLAARWGYVGRRREFRGGNRNVDDQHPTAGRGSGPTVEVTNTGQLPRVDATLFLTTDPKNAAAPLARRTVEYLAPGATYYWVKAYKTGGAGEPGGPVIDFLPPRPGAGKESPGLVVELPHRLAPGGRKPKPLPFEVRAGKSTPFRYGY